MIRKIIKLVTYPILFANRKYKQTNHFQNEFADMEKFVGDQAFNIKIPHDLQMVNLGSNHPKFALDYSDNDIKGMNWAVGPQTLEYDFMILKKFHSFLCDGATVIIPICPLKMFLYKYRSFDNIVKYYAAFDKNIIPDFSEEQYKRKYKYPLLYHPKRLKFLLKDDAEDQRMRLISNPMSLQQIKEDAKYWVYRCWNPEFDIDITNMKTPSKQNLEEIEANISILRQMIVFCIERGYKPVITYLPVTKYLSDMFPSDFIDTYVKAYVNRAVEDFDVVQYDYFRDPRFQNIDYYINSFFMNRVGAKIFTNIFVKEVFGESKFPIV